MSEALVSIHKEEYSPNSRIVKARALDRHAFELSKQVGYEFGVVIC